MAGTVNFRNASASGTVVSHLGSGIYDHIAFYGDTGPSSAIIINTFNGTTFIADDTGTVADVAGTSGQMTNCARPSADNTSGVILKVVGETDPRPERLITQVNTFDLANIASYPDFTNLASGTLMIEFIAPSSLSVQTFNAKLYAFDSGGAITDSPPDVNVWMFEISPSGQFRAEADHSGVWKLAHTRDSSLDFVNHSNANGWEAREQHIYLAAISVQPTAIGAIDDWDLAFSVQFI
ncbi:hypothetical protein KAR91_49955 [Candidatus Pacearchaeota archaeon]|nr:hypothetical protein [Candidatus Pacearchaeota archaeon]